MSIETERSSTESEVSGLDYEETALTLGLPGGARAAGSDPERKRGFSQTVDLALGTSRNDPRGGGGGGGGGGSSGDPSDESLDREVSRSEKPPAPKARVVGWPPVRSYRKNALKSCTFVKVAVDGRRTSGRWIWRCTAGTSSC
uniref:Auxin-responsive protein n=1 Tax=Ananas comosus var. bracteatus TaxID=296719 RepID=A0A6V7QIV5_ANACO|nr:unnamed protein product [Ananas comosus var. bracteatus]